MKFYRCTECDQIHIKLIDQNNDMTCCNAPTEELVENNFPDEARNHVPKIRKIGNFVTITIDNNHPMVDIHHIEFICMETNKGFKYKKLNINQEPKVQFILANDEEITNVYLYCNLHSLWSLH